MGRTAILRADSRIRAFVRNRLPRLRRALKPAQVWLFGSRVRGDALQESDLDVIVVSPVFEGIPWPRRSWYVLERAGHFPRVEMLLYSPVEFEIKRHELGIVAEALREGIRVL